MSMIKEVDYMDYKAALSCAMHDPWWFLKFPNLFERYPELIRFAILRSIEKFPVRFFRKGYDKEYPDLEYYAAKILARKNPIAFLRKGIHKRFPELVIKISRVP